MRGRAVHVLRRVLDDGTVDCAHCGIVPIAYRVSRGNRIPRCSIAIAEQRHSPRRNTSRHHGMTDEERLTFIGNRVCECCGGDSRLAVDHCHTTGALRGVLCQPCNLGIGQLGDDLTGVLRAVAYLTKVGVVTEDTGCGVDNTSRG